MLHQGRGGAPFLSLVAGDLSLANRIVMAALAALARVLTVLRDHRGDATDEVVAVELVAGH